MIADVTLHKTECVALCDNAFFTTDFFSTHISTTFDCCYIVIIHKTAA